MTPIPPPPWDACDDYDAIVKDKQSERRARLQSLRPTIRRIYDRYLTRAAERRLDQQWPATSIDDDVGRDLRHCYETPTESMKALRRRLMDLLGRHGKRRCPYCGIGQVTELDHYLPKVDFPELSVCAYNLIPCCHDCNHLRGDHDWDLGRRPSVIHVFYEKIDTEHGHLQARISFDDGEFDVVFSVIVDGRRPFSARFREHFETLNLAARYSLQAIDELSEFISDIGGALEADAELDGEHEVRQEASKRADRRTAIYGANHWKAAFYRAAAESPEVIALLHRGAAS